MRYLLVTVLVACSTPVPEPETRRPSCDEIARDAIEIGRQTGIAQERTRVAREATARLQEETWRLQAEAAGLEAQLAALRDIDARRASRRDGGAR